MNRRYGIFAAPLNCFRKATRCVPISLALMLTLSGCATTTDFAGPGNDLLTLVACRAFRPIVWIGADTDNTLRQVKAHNAVWRSLCGSNPRVLLRNTLN